MSSKTSEEKVVENSDEDASDEEPEYTLLYKANKFLGKEIDGMTQSFINEYAHEFDVEEDEHRRNKRLNRKHGDAADDLKFD